MKKIGTTSITIELEVRVKPALDRPADTIPELLVTEAAFTYVAVDEDGKKQAITCS